MIQLMDLYAWVSAEDILVAKFFDIHSDKMIDTKIKVLTQLKNGVPPSGIPEYYDILELYPPAGVLWD